MTPSTRRPALQASRFLTVLMAAALILSAGCKRDATPPVTSSPEPATPAPAPEPAPAPIPIEPPEPVYGPLFDLPPHLTEHYVIYSDAKPEVVADVSMRLEALHREYRREMDDVFQPNDAKAKALFIGDPDTFVTAGGDPRAPGVFRVITDEAGNIADDIGPRLVLRNSGDQIYIEISQLMQHEGWHQFCWNHVQQFIPIWLDEGLATYYSLGVWTGDSMIFGGIPLTFYDLLKKVRPAFISPAQLLTLDDGSWRAYQEQTDFWVPYMEALSIVQFLKHANGGEHAHLLDAYIAVYVVSDNGNPRALN